MFGGLENKFIKILNQLPTNSPKKPKRGSEFDTFEKNRNQKSFNFLAKVYITFCMNKQKKSAVFVNK